MLLSAVLLCSNINVGYHCLSSLLVDAYHEIHTQIIITWFDYTPFILVWEGCVACYHTIWKLILDNLSLISYTVKPLSALVVCVVFPQVSFIISGLEKLPTWAMHYYIICIVSRSVFFSCYLFIQHSWPWLIICLETSFPRKM